MPSRTPASDAWFQTRLNAACVIVREAGALALHHFRDESVRVERKGVQDYVTFVDRVVEELIVGRLRAAFPEDGFFGEEGGLRDEVERTRPLWVIDPIDGTTNYTHGLPLWCISVALWRDGEIAIGIIFNPVSDEFYRAANGQGATCNGRFVNVSAVVQPEQARIGMGFSYRRPPAQHVQGISRLLEARCEYCRFGSGALGMAYVADGRCDGYWEPHINAWDVLAGICLVREAGGRVNDFLSGDGLRAGNPILACTPALLPFLTTQLMSLCSGQEVPA